MNTSKLAKHYDALTPWERLPLIMAAALRGDEAERERLAKSAPTSHFTIPNHYGVGDGLQHLANVILQSLLELAALYWRASWLLAESSVFCKQQDAERGRRLVKTMRMLAFRFVVLSDAWELFCREHVLEPKAMFRLLPGYETVVQVDASARSLAFSADEARGYRREALDLPDELGREQPVELRYRLETAAEMAQQMREYVEDYRKRWS